MMAVVNFFVAQDLDKPLGRVPESKSGNERKKMNCTIMFYDGGSRFFSSHKIQINPGVEIVLFVHRRGITLYGVFVEAFVESKISLWGILCSYWICDPSIGSTRLTQSLRFCYSKVLQLHSHVA